MSPNQQAIDTIRYVQSRLLNVWEHRHDPRDAAYPLWTTGDAFECAHDLGKALDWLLQPPPVARPEDSPDWYK